MDQYRSRLKLSENFERHWSIRISGEKGMDQSLVHTFSWGNSYGPMVLKVLRKFPPTLVLVHGWLFPVFRGQKNRTRKKKTNSWERRFPGTFRTNVTLILPIFSLSFQWEEGQKFPGTKFLGTFFSLILGGFSPSDFFFRGLTKGWFSKSVVDIGPLIEALKIFHRGSNRGSRGLPPRVGPLVGGVFHEGVRIRVGLFLFGAHRRGREGANLCILVLLFGASRVAIARTCYRAPEPRDPESAF